MEKTVKKKISELVIGNAPSALNMRIQKKKKEKQYAGLAFFYPEREKTKKNERPYEGGTQGQQGSAVQRKLGNFTSTRNR